MEAKQKGMELVPQVLLHPPIPDPLHSVAPRVIMGQTLWDSTRKKCYKEQEYFCLVCGVHKEEAKYHKWLECHEFYNIDYNNKTMELKNFVALCHSCHNFIHSNRLTHIYKKKEISSSKYYTILHHGKKILQKANIEQEYLSVREYANSIDYGSEWSEWRMIWNGYSYQSALRTPQEHYEHYNVERRKDIKPIIEKI